MKPTDTMFHDSIIAAILCRSYKNPIPGAALAAQFGVDIRRIADEVRDARRAGHKIASSRGGWDRFMNVELEPGYYGGRRPEEMASTAEMLRNTGLDLLHTAKLLMDFGNVEPSLYEQRGTEGEAA